MLLAVNNVKLALFFILCVCTFFYLFLGIYSYKKSKESKTNILFFALCVSASLWAVGYAFMLVSPTLENANKWRMIASSGWMFFHGIWISFAVSLKDTNRENPNSKLQILVYIPLTLFFVNYLVTKPSEVVGIESYGFVDNLYSATPIGMVFSLYIAVLFMAGLVILFVHRRNSRNNRVRLQMKIILITGSISFCLAVISDLIFPALGIEVFPTGIVLVSIGVGGMWYAITKHKMMSISTELISEYIFQTVDEPIFILGEDFLVANCNGAALKISGYDKPNLLQNSLDAIINFRSFNFSLNTIIQAGNVTKIEVGLQRDYDKTLVYELSASIIYDSYKDILGFLVLLHDISEMRNTAAIEKKYTLDVEESNLLLKTEITDRILAEDKIRHLVYYDALTELPNRKKLLEEVSVLFVNTSEKFAVLFLDLDKFKSINDTYGHQAGDYILITVGVRLEGIIRSSDIISRIGGDEFIIILRNLKATENAEKIAEIIIAALRAAFSFNGNQLFIGGSIGISLFPEHGTDIDMLIKKADVAMYAIKSKGGNGYRIYSDELNIEE